MTLSPPSSLPPELQALWLQAAMDGERVGLVNGFMEQNPYELYEPLYEPWHLGWLEGVVQAPPRAYSMREFRMEQEAHFARNRRARAHFANLSLVKLNAVENKTGDEKCDYQTSLESMASPSASITLMSPNDSPLDPRDLMELCERE